MLETRHRRPRFPHSPALPALVLLALLGLGCDSSAEPPAAGDSGDADTGVATMDPADDPGGDATTADAGGLVPITSRGSADAGPEVDAAGLVVHLPEGWQPETPSSSMRAAQARIPGPGGDAQLTVFHFGPGGGGGVDSNLDRWAGQVEPHPGSTAIRDRFEHGDLVISWIEVQGTLKPSTMGTGPREPQPGSHLVGAVVEGPGGPWFFKVTGPADTVGPARGAFLRMLNAARVRG